MREAELLNREIFLIVREAQVLIGRWRQHCNWVQPPPALWAIGHRLLRGGHSLALPESRHQRWPWEWVCSKMPADRSVGTARGCLAYRRDVSHVPIESPASAVVV